MNKLNRMMLMALLILQCLFYFNTDAAHADRSGLRTVADALAKQLAQNFSASGYVGQKGIQKPVIFVSPNHFIDPRQKFIYPFSMYLNVEMQAALDQTGQFMVVDGYDFTPDLYLICDYFQERDHLNITCHFKGDVSPAGSDKIIFATIATGQSRLSRTYWSDNWFVEDVRDKIYYLMQMLEGKSFNELVNLAEKPRVLVRSLSFENTNTFSPFSNYISRYAVDYFSKSNVLIPITTRKGSPAGTIGASHFLDGSYWQPSPESIIVRCDLSNLNGEILASESIIIESRLINPEWLIIHRQEPLFSQKNIFIIADDGSSAGIERLLSRELNRLGYTCYDTQYIRSNISQAAWVNLMNQRHPDLAGIASGSKVELVILITSSIDFAERDNAIKNANWFSAEADLRLYRVTREKGWIPFIDVYQGSDKIIGMGTAENAARRNALTTKHPNGFERQIAVPVVAEFLNRLQENIELRSDHRDF